MVVVFSCLYSGNYIGHQKAELFECDTGCLVQSDFVSVSHFLLQHSKLSNSHCSTIFYIVPIFKLSVVYLSPTDRWMTHFLDMRKARTGWNTVPPTLCVLEIRGERYRGWAWNANTLYLSLRSPPFALWIANFGVCDSEQLHILLLLDDMWWSSSSTKRLCRQPVTPSPSLCDEERKPPVSLDEEVDGRG